MQLVVYQDPKSFSGELLNTTLPSIPSNNSYCLKSDELLCRVSQEVPLVPNSLRISEQAMIVTFIFSYLKPFFPSRIITLKGLLEVD